MSTDIRSWLRVVRADNRICMLIPMEACIGYPIEIKTGKEYLLPFYITDVTQEIYYPPFAYVRVSFPDGEILTYHDLRNDRVWSKINRASPIKTDSSKTAPRDYYRFLSDRIYKDTETELSADEVLKECIISERSGLTDCYELLIKEKEKF